jgi:hypothetical protein
MPKSTQGINGDLEDIEDAYGESKLSKTDKLIKALKEQYSEAEFDAVATDFFNLNEKDLDKDLYNKIKASYQGRKIKEQLGGECGMPKRNQLGGECGMTKRNQLGGECGYMPSVRKTSSYQEGTEQFGGVLTAEEEAFIKAHNIKGKFKRAIAQLPAANRPGYEANLQDPALAEHLRDAESDVRILRERGYRGEQEGGGCRFNVGKARCYSDKSSSVADECVSTTGPKGRQGCKRNPNMMPATFASRAPTKKSMAYAKKQESKEAKEIEEFFNDPIFDPINVDQLGGECGLMPHVRKPKRQLQTGGGCRFNVPQARCYADKSSVVAEECISTKGTKGRQGCKRNPNMMPATFSSRRPTKKSIALGKRLAAKESAPMIEESWTERLFNIPEQEGGFWSDDGDDMIDSRDTIVGEELEFEGGEQLGGGCRFNAGPGRCYSDKSDTIAPECTQTKGPKGNPGCARRENLQVATVGRAPGYTGRKVSEATKAKAAATRAANKAKLAAQGSGRTWISNPLFQEGGYWI